MAESSNSSQNELMERMMERFIHALQPLQTALLSIASNSSQTQSTNNNTPTPPLFQSHNTIHMEFPRFGGGDPAEWLHKADKFFTFHNISEAWRLEYASLHLDGLASSWFEWMEMTNQIHSWKDFVIALKVKFGPSSYEDPVEALTRLVQRGTVHEYQLMFQKLCCRTNEPEIPTMLNTALEENSDLLIELYDELPQRKFLTTHLGIESEESKNDENKRVVPIIPRNIDEVGILQVIDNSKEKQELKEISFSEYTIATKLPSPKEEVYADSLDTHMKGFVKDVLEQFDDGLFDVDIIEFQVVQIWKNSLGNFTPYLQNMVFHKWKNIIWLICRDVVTKSQIFRSLLLGDVVIFHKWKDRVKLSGGWLALLLLKILMVLPTLWILLQKGDEGIKSARKRRISSNLYRQDMIYMGPKERNDVIEQSYGAPTVTKDGVTVAKNIEFNDKMKNTGASLVKQVTNATNDAAGGDTTCATVLTRAIFTEGCKSVAAGINAMDRRCGITMAVDVVTNLKSRARMISASAEIAQVDTISVNGEREVGESIATSEIVGKERVITTSYGKTMSNKLEIVEGMRLDRGYIFPYKEVNFAYLSRDGGSLYDLNARKSDPMEGGHLGVHMFNNPIQSSVSVLLVHVVISGSALISQPNAKILHSSWVHHLSIVLFNLLQLPQKIPELGFGSDFIGHPELHTEDLEMLISFHRKPSSDNLIMMKPEISGSMTIQMLEKWEMLSEEEENGLNVTNYEKIQKVEHHEDMVTLEGWSNDTVQHDEGPRSMEKESKR